MSQLRDPKSIKNQQKIFVGHPRAFLSAPLHQMTAKVMQKWFLRTQKCSINVYAIMHHAMSIIIEYLDDYIGIYMEAVGTSIDFTCPIQSCKSFESCKSSQSCKSFKSCKSLQLANYQSAGCQRGRRQGRSLKILFYNVTFTLLEFEFSEP